MSDGPAITARSFQDGFHMLFGSLSAEETLFVASKKCSQ